MAHQPCTSCKGTTERDACLHETLRRELEAAGCFDRAPAHYALRALLTVAGIAIGYLVAWNATSWAAILVGAALAAFATVQAAFVAHEIGDGALTMNKRLSMLLNQALMTFMTGTSASYFDHVHHLHHQVVLRPMSDGKARNPIENRYEIKSLKAVFAGNGTLFAAAMLLLRGLCFRVESFRFIVANPKRTRGDVVALALHYAVWLGGPALVFGATPAVLAWLSVAIAAGPYIGYVLVINHESMRTADSLADTSKVDRVLKTTRNLPATRFNQIVLGGVNNHIEHHLFPTMPGVHLPRARRIVEARLRHHTVPYTVASLRDATMTSLRHFRKLRRDERMAAALT